MKMLAALSLAVLVAVAYANPAVVEEQEDLDHDLPRGVQKLYKVNYTIPLKHRSIRADFATWSTCGGDGTLKIHDLMIPGTLKLPSTAAIGVDVEFLQDFPNFAVDVVLEKKMGLWINIPCSNNIGTCYYDDICALMDGGENPIPEQLLDKVCPFVKARYTRERLIELPSIDTGSNLVSGRYRLTANFYKHPNVKPKTLHLCLKVELDIDA